MKQNDISLIRRSSIQRHHISYDPETMVRVFQKEHWALTLIERFNPISKGFLRCLRSYIKRKKDLAIKLPNKKR